MRTPRKVRKSNSAVAHKEFYGTEHEITYPNIKSEFEIHALIYSSLKEKGIDVRGEVPYRYKSSIGKIVTCRFDLVIFDNGKADTIIEVKREGRGMGERQTNKYSKFGCKVVEISGEDKAYDFINEIGKKYA